MRLGVLILPSHRWSEARRCWRLADEAGFAHAWTYDHITWRDLAGSPWYASTPTLAAAAEATGRLQLGALVTTPNFRHPVPFAKEVCTLGDLSDDRFVLGVGAGAGGADAGVLGGEPGPGDRMARFAEFTELLDILLREPVVDFSGRFYCARQAGIDPTGRAASTIPLAVAASGPRSMRLAARFGDVWVTNGTSPAPGRVAPSVAPEVVADQLRRLEEACDAEGRDFAGMRKLLLNVDRRRPPLASLEAFRDAFGTYRELGMTDMVIPFPRTQPPFVADFGVFEAVIGEFLSAGTPDADAIRRSAERCRER